MFGMSSVDILGSIAMALTTLPMPKSLPDVGSGDEFPIPYEDWSGTKLGNTQTCEVQGFFFTFGITSMLAYNAMLCVYYACAIALKMKERSICKYVEPILHMFPFFVGLSYSLAALIDKTYNPSAWEAWCSPKPLGCNMADPDINCLRGSYKAYRIVDIIMTVNLGLLVFVVITSLSMVSLQVIRTSRDFEVLLKAQLLYARQMDLPQRESFPIERIRKSHETTKAVLRQALVYVLAFVVTLISPIIQSIHTSLNLRENSYWPNYLELVFTPLQGFFNFGIFLYYKVDNYRRRNPDISISEVLRLLFKGSLLEPVMITRMWLLQFDEEDKKVLQLRIIDENEEEYFGHDVSNLSPQDEIDSADRKRVNEGLSFIFKNVPHASQSLCRNSVEGIEGDASRINELGSGASIKLDSRTSSVGRSVSILDGASARSRGGLSEFDELGSSASIQLDSCSHSFAQNVSIPDGVSSRGGLSGFDESESSSVHECKWIDDSSCQLTNVKV